MNADETVERLRKRYDVTLPSGLNVTIRLPRLREAVYSGGVPVPIMQHVGEKLSASNGETASDLTPEEVATIAAFQDQIVLRTLVAIEGEPVEMTLEAVAELDQEDYDALANYGTRTTPVPTTASVQT